jgi:NRPS condensation-like uncharacterized protein
LKEVENVKDIKAASVPSRFPLDNAATIYPACRTRNWNNVYRFAIIFKEEINPVLLQQAVDDFYNRLPTYFVRLRTGAFWYYFERIRSSRVVVQEDYYPCRAVNLFDSEKPCFRVMYYKRRLSLEAFHGVADGGASLIFIKSIAARYLQLLGYKIEISGDLLNCEDSFKESEFEDSFKRHAVKVKGVKRSEVSSYQYEANPIPNYYKVIHGLIPVEDLKALSKEYSITITEYLSAVLLYAFYLDAPKPCKKPIKKSIPISLRNSFESNSLRNFSLYTNIGFDATKKNNYTFEEVLEEIRGKLREGMDKEKLLKTFSKNVGDAGNPFVRFMPSGIKRQVLNLGFKKVGQNQFIASMTNLGIAKMPDSAMEHIDRFEVLLGETPVKHIAIALISDGKNMNISFTSNAKRVDVQRFFFTFLSQKGASVRIECNDKESWFKQ